jgi:hypothetical protein
MSIVGALDEKRAALKLEESATTSLTMICHQKGQRAHGRHLALPLRMSLPFRIQPAR